MSELPESIQRLDTYRGAARIGHETITRDYRVLVDRGIDDGATRDQYAEAARIVTVEFTALVERAERLAGELIDQHVLDPASGAVTSRALSDELDRIHPALSALIDRQRRIASAFQSRARGKR